MLEATGPDSVKAEIVVKMGAMSMTFAGTRRGHREGRRRPPRGAQGQVARGRRAGTRQRDVTFQLHDGGGTIHTNAQITGKAASMGEGVVGGVLDALITDFAGKLGEI